MPLIAHVDTRRVSESAVLAVKRPRWTDTWHPVSHAEVINALETAVKHEGLKIVSREYSMNKEKTKMFGAWDLRNGGKDKDKIWALGLRNGIAKNLSVGICAGERVFVCDNLAFSGAIINFRKHTKGLDSDVLGEMARDAVQRLEPHFKEFDNWLKRLGAVPLTEADIKRFLYDLSIEEGIIPASSLTAVHNNILGEHRGAECTMDLRGLHGAITRSLRGDSLFTVQARSSRLVGFTNDWMNRQN